MPDTSPAQPPTSPSSGSPGGDIRHEPSASLLEGTSLALQVVIVLLLMGCLFQLRVLASLHPPAPSSLAGLALPPSSPGSVSQVPPTPSLATVAPQGLLPGASGGGGQPGASGGTLQPDSDIYDDLMLHDLVLGLLLAEQQGSAEQRLTAEQKIRLRSLEAPMAAWLGRNVRTPFPEHVRLVALLKPVQLAAIRAARTRQALVYPADMATLVPRWRALLGEATP